MCPCRTLYNMVYRLKGVLRLFDEFAGNERGLARISKRELHLKWRVRVVLYYTVEANKDNAIGKCRTTGITF